MKKFWAAVAIIAVGAGLFFLLRSKNPPPESPSSQNGMTAESGSNPPPWHIPLPAPFVASNGPAASTDELASHAASPNSPVGSTTDTNESPILPPETVLDKARVMMHNYRSAFGENPVGTNPEITAALMGKNPKQINFVADSGLHVNEKGEMVDAYGTPFFFHQISGQEMEIRSAGKDRIMWTFDDLVTR
jgi:hypothetical protein